VQQQKDSPHDVMTLQRSLGNHKTQQIVMAARGDKRKRDSGNGTPKSKRKASSQLVSYDGSAFIPNPNGKRSFSYAITKAMNLDKGQARAHTIAYGEILRRVIDPVNAALGAGSGVKGYLTGLLDAVYPNGPHAEAHEGHPNHAKLEKAATKYHRLALGLIAAIDTQVVSDSPDHAQLADYMSQLVATLNNSPDNLRPGDSSTNSSIQDALDLTQDNAKPDVLAPNEGDRVNMYNAKGEHIGIIYRPLKVIRVTDLHEKQLTALFSSTYAKETNLELRADGPRLQSSDFAKMTVDNMADLNEPQVAIPWKGSEGDGYLIFNATSFSTALAG
ncbi:MAG: hypothetical protein AAF125_03200, partial [Chloroflexota bacterium]